MAGIHLIKTARGQLFNLCGFIFTSEAQFIAGNKHNIYSGLEVTYVFQPFFTHNDKNPQYTKLWVTNEVLHWQQIKI